MKVKIIIFALSLGVGSLTYQEWSKPLDTSSVTESRPRAELRLVENGPAPTRQVPPMAKFSQLLNRPLFSPTRRPPQPRPVEPKIVEEQILQPAPVAKLMPVNNPQLTVVGIIIKPEQQIALVREPGGTELKRLFRGDQVDGWMVEAILPKQVILSSQENIFELKLEELKNPQAPRPDFPMQQGIASVPLKIPTQQDILPSQPRNGVPVKP